MSGWSALIEGEQMNLVRIDARVGAPSRFVSDAVVAELNTDLSALSEPARLGRHPLPSLTDWCATVGRWGIVPQTDVVVFDDKEGGKAAARCWWMLMAIGHTRVRVQTLDQLLVDPTVESVDTPSTAPGGPSYPATEWTLPVATDADVDRARTDPLWRVVDARSAERFRGESEPYDSVAGHIPGAVNLPWADHTDLGVFNTAYTALAGTVPADRTIVHCGSGVTACHTLLQLHRLGRELPALYVGSWSAWSRQGRPVGRCDTR